MNLLGAILYDPAVAVNKVTTAAIAMTALDTTNLRLAITVPAHGKVRFHLSGTLHGATTMPQIMLGVMNGAAIIGRVAPMIGVSNAAATSLCKVEVEFTATGLTPGALNADAAYGVETLVAATGLKYGGPNNTTANDNFGAFVFEAFDPQPIPTVAPGAAGGLFIAGTNAATTITTGLTAHIIGTVDTLTTYTGNTVQTGDSFAIVKAAGTGDNAAIKAKTDLIPAAPASTTNITAASGVALAASQHVIVDSGTVTTLSNLPSIPANWLTAAGINAAALNGKGDWNVGKTGYSLTSQNWSVAGDAMALTAAYDAAKTALAASAYTAPDNTSIAAVKTKTDQLTFAVEGCVDANAHCIHAQLITGSGTSVDPWKPV